MFYYAGQKVRRLRKHRRQSRVHDRGRRRLDESLLGGERGTGKVSLAYLFLLYFYSDLFILDYKIIAVSQAIVNAYLFVRTRLKLTIRAYIKHVIIPIIMDK